LVKAIDGDMKEFFKTLSGFIWPIDCAGCGNRLQPGSIPACQNCLRRIEKVDCEALVARMSYKGLTTSHWRKVFALWVFDKRGLVQSLHHTWKYGGGINLGFQLGVYLGRALCTQQLIDPVSPGCEALIPVPLSNARYIERGYNQSMILSRGVASVTGQRLIADGLIRKKQTRSQVGLSMKKRKENVQNAFAVRHRDTFYGKHIWLVDDVVTTGATLWAATIPLIQAGALSVSILTLSAARV